MTPAREWDGRSYDRISKPMEDMGRVVLDRLPLEGHERVLDAGCGSGRVTAGLLERLPDGHVVGIDGSQEMVDAARDRLRDEVEAGRLTLLKADLLDLALDEPVDAVLSTATFHWIKDHDALFRNIRAVLRPGGRFVAQCGGQGNVESVHAAAEVVGGREPFAPFLAGWAGPWNFQDPDSTARRLREAGFTDIETWLEPWPVETHDGLEWLRTIVCGSHLERLPTGELEEAFVAQVGELLGTDPLTVDYVRLNITAAASNP